METRKNGEAIQQSSSSSCKTLTYTQQAVANVFPNTPLACLGGQNRELASPSFPASPAAPIVSSPIHNDNHVVIGTSEMEQLEKFPCRAQILYIQQQIESKTSGSYQWLAYLRAQYLGDILTLVLQSSGHCPCITAAHLQGSVIQILVFAFFCYQDLPSTSPRPDCVIEQSQIKHKMKSPILIKEKPNVRRAQTLVKIFNMVAIKSFSNCISK